MYKVAVCDDEYAVCNQFEHVLSSYILEKNVDLDIFGCGEELVRELSNGQRFDLIFLDIKFQSMDGVEVGKFIRNILCDESTQIVYISANQQYAMELFKIRPMDFLIKPIPDKCIIDILEKAIYLDGVCKRYFVFKKRSENIRIPYGHIIYFESDNRKITVYEETKSHELYGKLSIIQRDAPSFFLRIHQSYFVNTNKITRWKPDSVIMTGSIHLPVSQKYRKKVNQFLLGEGK